jgi:RNA-binding protein 8A
MNGVNKSDGICGKKVQVDWAFKKPTKKGALKPTKK